jgi:4-amino-4-deoxy-L-arabinose transferase-like glycosyltransferase
MAAYSDSEAAGGRLLRLLVVAVFAGLIGLAGLNSLPPLDRDEARFAQATAQMLETGDFVAIRFQGEERNKKPVGIHWLQAASVALFSDASAREISAYRLPSLFGGVIAALFTYLAGARLYGPQTGFLAALLLAAAPVFAAEASIAKTDAMLLASVSTAQAAFIHIFARWTEERPVGWSWPLLFWGALGAGILIKGPIAPMIVAMTGAMLFFRERKVGWVLALRPLLGAAILALAIGPWAIMIGVATEGRFFSEALGDDMFRKLGAAQESHSGPPGYHFVLLSALFWPATALIAPGFAQAIATRRAWPAWFLLSWIAPAWIVFELTATKLPHYTLPLYPAIAILAGRAASIGVAQRRPLMRKLGAVWSLFVGLAGAALIVALPILFAANPMTATTSFFAALLAAASGAAALLYWKGRSYEGALISALAGFLLAFVLLTAILPRLERLEISPRISEALAEENLHPLKNGAAPVAVAGYYEPSIVFLLGTPTRLTDAEGAANHLAEHRGAVVVEGRLDEAFRKSVATRNLSVASLAAIEGLNYSNGREARLTIYRVAPR